MIRVILFFAIFAYVPAFAQGGGGSSSRPTGPNGCTGYDCPENYPPGKRFTAFSQRGDVPNNGATQAQVQRYANRDCASGRARRISGFKYVESDIPHRQCVTTDRGERICFNDGVIRNRTMSAEFICL